ncbi:MAG: hypothetical protein LZF62_40031 [Nitrospira sp.]|nr:MAG: hypothetical protein LZF62_40031 [Nitrospira sp.]
MGRNVESLRGGYGRLRSLGRYDRRRVQHQQAEEQADVGERAFLVYANEVVPVFGKTGREHVSSFPSSCEMS